MLSQPAEAKDWSQYQMLVLTLLQEHSNLLVEINKEITTLKVDLAVQRGKNIAYGTIAAAVTGGVVAFVVELGKKAVG